MDSNELSDKLEEQAHESEAEGELAEPAESDDMELTLDDLDYVAGGKILGKRITPKRHKFRN